MVLFIKDENKLRDLWSKGIVTKVICSKIDNLPRTIELRTTTGKIVRPIQKLALPEYEIVDPPISNFLNVYLLKALSFGGIPASPVSLGADMRVLGESPHA